MYGDNDDNYYNTYLGSGGSSNERGGGMLNLHLVQQNIAILGDLDVTSTGHQHLHCSTRSQIGFEDILDSLGGGDVDGQSPGGSSHFSLGIQQRDGRHDELIGREQNKFPAKSYIIR